MLTKFVNLFDNYKLRIRKHYLVSLSYLLLHLLTLRLFDNPAPGSQVAADGRCERDVVHRMNEAIMRGIELWER